MIVTSIHDPDVFSPSRAEDAAYIGLLTQHMRNVTQHHVIISDTENRMGRRVLANFKELPPKLQQVLSALPPERIVRLKPVEARLEKMDNTGILEEGSAEAVALTGYPFVDVFVASDAAMLAMEDVGISISKCSTLEQYPASAAADKQQLGDEAIQIGGEPDTFLRDNVLCPVLNWATEVGLYDKMLCRAVLGASSNRNSFRKTVQFIYDTWKGGTGHGNGRFRIVTVEDSDRAVAGQAAALAEKLQLPKEKVQILVKSGKYASRYQHDRYLATNQSFVVGFSHGFDIIDEKGICRPCEVSLRRRKSKDEPLDEYERATTVEECEW